MSSPLLACGIRSSRKIPRLLKWDCANNTCEECGVDELLQMSTCKVLGECNDIVDCLEWIQADRQSENKGKQNTQLELGSTKLSVRMVVSRLISRLVTCREHCAQYQWRNQMRKVDMTMGDLNLHRVICTDFGASLDLCSAEKNNCSVDNRAVICILFVVYNRRNVSFQKMSEIGEYETDEMIANDCDRWVFFGDTMSKGKKNDHIFHQSCCTYVIKHYDSMREAVGKTPIPFNIIWTDNCPTQYKCRQNFLNVATSTSNHTSNPDVHHIAIHNFAQKYRFKGGWDATGKIVKERILNNELKGDRCATAFDCYIKLGRDLTKNGEDEKSSKLLEYENNNDERVIKNTTLTTKKTHIGFGTQDKDQYDSLMQNKTYKHIIFTNRTEIPDMKPTPQTLKISQVQGDREICDDGNCKLTTSHLPCSCPQCRHNPSLTEERSYKNVRHIQQHSVRPISEGEVESGDEFGLKLLTCADLRTELKSRGLVTSGLKADLVSRMHISLEGERDDFADDDVVGQRTNILGYTPLIDAASLSSLSPLSTN